MLTELIYVLSPESKLSSPVFNLVTPVFKSSNLVVLDAKSLTPDCKLPRPLSNKLMFCDNVNAPLSTLDTPLLNNAYFELKVLVPSCNL